MVLVTTLPKRCALYVDCTVPWCRQVHWALPHSWAAFHMYSLCLPASAWDLRLTGCVPMAVCRLTNLSGLSWPSLPDTCAHRPGFPRLAHVPSQTLGMVLSSAHVASLNKCCHCYSELGFRSACCSSFVGHGLAPLGYRSPGGLCPLPFYHFNLVCLHC